MTVGLHRLGQSSSATSPEHVKAASLSLGHPPVALGRAVLAPAIGVAGHQRDPVRRRQQMSDGLGAGVLPALVAADGHVNDRRALLDDDGVWQTVLVAASSEGEGDQGKSAIEHRTS